MTDYEKFELTDKGRSYIQSVLDLMPEEERKEYDQLMAAVCSTGVRGSFFFLSCKDEGEIAQVIQKIEEKTKQSLPFTIEDVFRLQELSSKNYRQLKPDPG